MKKIFTTVFTICLSVGLFAQTAGTLTFTFTQVAHSPCYQSNYNVLAAWIETSSGTFVKTKLRYCCGGNTLDHLPTWSVNAGGTSSNSSAANKTDATTGSTLHGFGTKTFTWDGKNVNGTSNGTLVADGTYKVAIQETWNHGGGNTVTTYYTFTKGPAADHQTPATDANFSTISLDWVPATTTGIDEESENPQFNIYPNPSNGIFNLELFNVNTIKVLNTLGSVVYQEKINTNETKSTIDLSNLANGIYFIAVLNDKGTLNKKVIISK